VSPLPEEAVIRNATPGDCLSIAELALIAGDGIPGYFWADYQQPGQNLAEAGAMRASIPEANFSWRNCLVACIDGEVAAMLLAYRLPAAADNDEDPAEFPEFVRPLVELEQCVAESFYINMLAAYPRFRGRGLGTKLMERIDGLARAAGCDLISIEVFENNRGALRLYRRLGYELRESRPIIASDYVEAQEVLLLTRPVSI
jgi:ribosomal protein S18 acetylase RimI-like enzyme